MTQQQQDEPRRQTPEETMARIAGVPKTAEELESEREQLEHERTRNFQRNAGIVPDQGKPPVRPASPPVHTETERQREKA